MSMGLPGNGAGSRNSISNVVHGFPDGEDPSGRSEGVVKSPRRTNSFGVWIQRAAEI